MSPNTKTRNSLVEGAQPYCYMLKVKTSFAFQARLWYTGQWCGWGWSVSWNYGLLLRRCHHQVDAGGWYTISVCSPEDICPVLRRYNFDFEPLIFPTSAAVQIVATSRRETQGKKINCRLLPSFSEPDSEIQRVPGLWPSIPEDLVYIYLLY